MRRFERSFSGKAMPYESEGRRREGGVGYLWPDFRLNFVFGVNIADHWILLARNCPTGIAEGYSD